MKKLILFFVLLLSASPFMAQDITEKSMSQYVNPDELVTLSENLSFDQAIAILNRISERSAGKRIVSTISSNTPIGVQIDKMPYKKALAIIVQYAGYTYDEGEDVIIVKKRTEGEEKKLDASYTDIDTREVKISTVFFEGDVGEMRARGINWKFLFSSDKFSFGGDIKNFIEAQTSDESSSSTANKQQETNAVLNGAGTFNVGDYVGDVTGAFRFFETENLGEIIASPSVTVKDNYKGRIQIGSDFSIKTRDFSGNLVDKFFSTGSIIEVTPHIYKKDNIDYILLDLMVDRSSATPSELSTEIKRTSANTQILLLNGEETVIGGLFVTDEAVERTGIPFLKDLPWWVLGIRYLTGSDKVTTTKKEVIILVKVELLPTLRERMVRNEDYIQKTIDENKEKIKIYKSNAAPELK
jgi:type IV pilus assembly protein PilQ